MEMNTTSAQAKKKNHCTKIALNKLLKDE